MIRKTPLRSISEKRRAKGTKTGMMRRSSLGRGKPLAKVGKQKAKRQARNAEYYKSPEWRAKRKAVFERDDYQCAEVRGPYFGASFGVGYDAYPPVEQARCPNRGEVVNDKQTARGLVCEERSYGHRGNPDRIDTCTTRCKDCDRRLTPLERINHAHGFSGRQERDT